MTYVKDSRRKRKTPAGVTVSSFTPKDAPTASRVYEAIMEAHQAPEAGGVLALQVMARAGSIALMQSARLWLASGLALETHRPGSPSFSAYSWYLTEFCRYCGGGTRMVRESFECGGCGRQVVRSSLAIEASLEFQKTGLAPADQELLTDRFAQRLAHSGDDPLASLLNAQAIVSLFHKIYATANNLTYWDSPERLASLAKL